MTPQRSAATTARLVALLAVLTGGAPLPVAAEPASFDLVVSLEADPEGNERDRYEDILADFAAAVFEATEGAHTIGTIQVYTNATAHDRADIVWPRQGHPKAALNGIRGAGQIYMVDEFIGGSADGDDLSLTNHDDEELGATAAGAVLAHEWAHYAYGLLDEHQIQAGDMPVAPSLMNSPWNAAPVGAPDERWLNFSIAGIGTGPFQNTGATAQHRAYQRSAWELISQAPGLGAMLTAPIPGRVERVFYPDLVAPGAEPLLQAPGPTVAISWEAPCSSYVIAIDKSSSMTGQGLSTAKLVADLLVDFLPADRTELTIVSFSNTGTVEMGPAIVSDEGTLGQTSRDLFHDAVQAVAAVPSQTSFSAGLDTAIGAFGACTENLALFFISDSTNTPGDDVASSLLAYATPAETRIFALDVSPFDPDQRLNEMTPLVAATGGILLSPPAGFVQTQEAWRQADAPTRIQHQLEGGEITVETSGGSDEFTFTVDPTLDRFEVCAMTTGPVDTLLLEAPTGVSFPAIVARDSETGVVGDDCSWLFTQSPPTSFGEWTLSGRGDEDAPEDVVVSFVAKGQSDDSSTTLRAWLSNAGGEPVQYPEPIHVTASLGRDLPVIGARINATIDGGSRVPLRDDGTPPDAFPGDGIYVGSLVYDSDGLHQIEITADNDLGIAKFSASGLVTVPGIAGNLVEAEAETLLGSDLTRILDLTVETAGLADAPLVPLVDDSKPVWNGRIAAADEIDLYEIDLATIDAAEGSPGNLEIRVTGALLGMRPRLAVYDTDPGQGGTLIEQATASSGTNGITVPIQAMAGTVFAEVTHASGSTGTYQLSAGRVLGLVFGEPGLSASPCDLAQADKNEALTALKDGLDGVAAARVLISESRTLERMMRDALGEMQDISRRERQARKLLRGATHRDTKALKRLEVAETKGRSKELKGAKRKIRNARKKLRKACDRLDEGGANLLP